MSKTMNLYHVTSYDSAVRILDSGGIDPKFTQGKRGVVWYVRKTLVPWAIAHVAYRHSLTIEQIAILYVKVDTSFLLRTNRGGVYCTAHVLKPLTMDAATVWLNRQEMRVQLLKGKYRNNGFPGTNRQDKEDLSEL